MSPELAQVQTSLTHKEIGQTQRLLSDPTVFPPIFKQFLTNWTEQQVSLGEIPGWAEFVANQATLDAGQDAQIATNTADIAALTGGGTGSLLQIDVRTNALVAHGTTWYYDSLHSPRLASLAAGTYAVGYGANVVLSALAGEKAIGQVGISLNGATPTAARTQSITMDNQAGAGALPVELSCAQFLSISASTGDGLQVLYQSNSGTLGTTGAAFGNPWLVAYRYA